MGWGIKIPALNIDTGEFIGGDVGKVLTNISREANTPIGRGVIGTMVGGPWLGAALAGEAAVSNANKSTENVQKASTDFSPLTSKWEQLQGDITGKMPQQAIQDLSSQSQVGVQSGLQSLGQKGGQGIGAANRLQTQSKWDVAQGAAGINQGAQEMANQFAMNKITGVDVPVMQGQQLSLAQQQAALARGKAATGQAVGNILGMAAGGYLGAGTALGAGGGAMIGGQIGSGVGQSVWG